MCVVACCASLLCRWPLGRTGSCALPAAERDLSAVPNAKAGQSALGPAARHREERARCASALMAHSPERTELEYTPVSYTRRSSTLAPLCLAAVASPLRSALTVTAQCSVLRGRFCHRPLLHGGQTTYNVLRIIPPVLLPCVPHLLCVCCSGRTEAALRLWAGTGSGGGVGLGATRRL
jgi:hypothetical protein